MEETYSILEDLFCVSRYRRSTAEDQKDVASANTPPCMNDRCVEVIIYHPAWSHTGFCQRQDVKGEFTSLGHDLMAYSLGEAEKTV